MSPHRVLVEFGPVRLDLFLSRRFDGFSRSYFKDLIKRGLVRVDGSPRAPDYKLRGGEVVLLDMGESGWADVPFEKWVIFEDEDLLVLNKPSGLLAHPLGDSWINRPEAALSEKEANLAGLVAKFRPGFLERAVGRCGIVHRLDRQTSGVILVAANFPAQEELLAAFRERRVEKVYRTIVLGNMGKTVVEAPIGRKPGHRKVRVSPWGKEASTEFKPLETAKGLTLVQAKPLTGRTHQIRAHAAHAGFPVLGDVETFKTKELDALKERGHQPPPRMMLHAYRIRFAHPATGKKLSFTAPLPKDFKDYWKSCSPFKTKK